MYLCHAEVCLEYPRDMFSPGVYYHFTFQNITPLVSLQQTYNCHAILVSFRLLNMYWDLDLSNECLSLFFP